MPFYEYQCKACGYEDTLLESYTDSRSKTCPQCKKRQAFKRLISAAGFQLKGTGWYATDFKDKPKKADDKKSSDSQDDAAKESKTKDTADNKDSKDGKDGKDKKTTDTAKDSKGGADKANDKASDKTSKQKSSG